MEIETYEESEVRETCVDDKNELIAIAEKLGATGQLKILQSGDQVRTFPYRRITLQEERVYETLFSQKTKFTDFAESIIPVRIMQVAAHAIQFPETQYLTVWHNRSLKDPILVGSKDYYSSEKYILARWGDALESLNVLKKKAIEVLRPKLAMKLSEIKSSLQSWEAASDSRIENYLNGEGSYSVPQYFE